MALATLQNIRVAGLASAVPRQIVSNLEYDQVPEEKRQRIVKFTGIQYRRVGPRELCTSDLCEAAARRLLDELGWRRDEVGAVLFVSQTFDYIFPDTAQSLQARLELPKECLAFDVNLGCSGYTYGLYILGHLMEAAGIKRGLLVAGDASKSDLTTDPSSAVIFGNGGSATALELSQSGKPIYFEAGSDGAGYKVIYIPDGGGRSPLTAESFVKKPAETGGMRDATDIILDGSEIMNFALREVTASVKRLLEFAEQRDVAGIARNNAT
jgi:3-oxoacyl-[acyl-carrier-protein] synthase-3